MTAGPSSFAGASSIMRRVLSPVTAQAPLRIALGGGGTDLPSHYRDHGGFALSAAIDRYVRMRVSAAPNGLYSLDHLEREAVSDPQQIGHPILRAAINRHGDGRPLSLVSEGDVEPGTGLGSSGAYAVCAVKAVGLLAERGLVGHDLAEAACTIEIADMGRTVGKQDQYASAFGGVNAFSFRPDGGVDVRRLELPASVRDALRERFLLFFTGHSRSAAEVLSGQVERTLAGDPGLERNLLRTAAAARESARAFEGGDLDAIAALMNEQWALKHERVAHASVPRIEELRDVALASGAYGAMLMGAGGGGYLLAYTPDPQRLREVMEPTNAPELSFDLDFDGCLGQVAGKGQ